MKPQRQPPPPKVTVRQVEASDPGHSAWVSANAGSGKTHVLAQRVIRLLLDGVDPARILCITFTKAAAANMSNRVFNELRQWTLLDDAALDEAMRRIGVKGTGPAQRERARRLFALALETPGGLKVQTIHAFCTQLLHLFPFEANVAARFEVLDETAERQMLQALSLGVMQEAVEQPDSALGRALEAAVLAASDQTFQDTVRETIRQREAITRWIDGAGGVPQAMAQLSQALGIDPEVTAAHVEAEIFDGSLFLSSEWASVAAALAQGTKTDKEQAARFAALATLEMAKRLDAYIDIFCVKNREKTKERLATKKIQDDHPDLCQRLNDERDRVWSLLLRLRAIEARDRSVALFTIAYEVIGRFRAEKNRQGRLDYEDLIEKTLALLGDTSAAWVHYKLDRGIHHVLIDEAQDTSPRQWEIVKMLVAEFFAGRGAHDRPRTIFAVGDEKQSIFSFQGAAPNEFDDMKRFFKTQHHRAGLTFVPTEFLCSFRSGANVLTAVDLVFSNEQARAGLSADKAGPQHEWLPDAAPGLVEIWELDKSDDKSNPDPWDAPFDRQNATSGTVKLARRIAGTVAAWLQQGRSAKDVLVLVRRRGALFEAIIRALKNSGIPVAGADRLVLTEHIAVMDLMVLADALLLPHDDLTLATVLKSPLFGLDDDALFDVAYGRPGSLRDALESKRPDLAGELDRLAEAARRQTPFGFYAELLGPGGGRSRILTRLGHEAADALDEFLNLALDYERLETPSLQGFVAWLRAAEAEIKRDMEMARDEVRVMTVHGAKGLEAPIVILADTTTPPAGWHPPALLNLPHEGAPGAAMPFVWAKAKSADTPAMASARAAALGELGNEYRRLLYVAMTRAIDRLVVCGVDNGRKLPEGCWYELVRGALLETSTQERADFGDADVWRYRKELEPPPTLALAPGETPAKTEIPRWLRQPVAGEPPPVRTVKPSGFVEDPRPAVRAGQRETRAHAIAHGLAVHRLLQSLPDVPADRRAAKAGAFLARKKEFDEAERHAIAQSVLAILDDKRFAPLFGPGSRAEVSIAGRAGGRPLAGQVDRLVVTPDSVLIADYKANRAPPASPVAALRTHGAYVTQLALYRDVLTKLYPGRPVRAALIWTETPELMEFDASMLDEALNIAVTSL